MIDKIEKINCTGCKMCADLCPNGAISYENDIKGFWYPIVDERKCNQCSLCIRTCPGMSEYLSDKKEPEVYSAWLKNDEMRLKSTSGGIYFALAKQFISKGEYIVGCQYTDDYKGAFHVITNSSEGLEKIIGSKYFQSDTAGIYVKIKSLLDADKEVLFCGTPCQSAGLQNYLERSYPKLTTVDFVCKGINSPKIYREYMMELETKYSSKIRFVHMKNKRTGWQSLGFYVKFQNDEEYFRSGKDDLWVQGYLRENLYTRPSCHYCRFKTIPRVSDISLGDFWGIAGASKKEIFKGISLVMINSDKGEVLFNKIQPEIHFEHRSLEEAVYGNPSILQNVSTGKKSEAFFEQLGHMSVSESIKSCLINLDERDEPRDSITMNRKILNLLRLGRK